MPVWVQVSNSCENCHKMGARAYDHEPTAAEIQQAERELGGMYCIRSYIFSGEVNEALTEAQEVW